MKNALRGLLLLLIVAAAFVAGFAFRGWLEVDKCLDRGGRWDEGSKACEFAEQRVP